MYYINYIIYYILHNRITLIIFRARLIEVIRNYVLIFSKHCVVIFSSKAELFRCKEQIFFVKRPKSFFGTFTILSSNFEGFSVS